MSLPASQQRALNRIEEALVHDHPGLGPLFAIFTRLVGHEAMPVTERVTARRMRMRIRMRPGVATVVALVMAIGVLAGISLLLPRPQVCASGTVSPVAARVQSVSAGHEPACPAPPPAPGSTSAPSAP